MTLFQVNVTVNKDRTYIDGRFIGKSGRLVADILETTNLENIKSYLLAIDSEKVLNSCFRKICLWA